MEKLSFDQLERSNEWKKAVVVFTEDSYEREFSELERSYKISHDNKYFSGIASGNSLFGSCLDGKDNNVRLDIYMSLLPKEGRRWKVEYCYIVE